MQNATLYARLSNEARDTNVSLAGMMADLVAYATASGFAVVAQHIDNGISGAVRDRPEFLAWLNDARTGRADVMIAYSADRITREGINAASMVLDVVEGKDPITGKVVRPPVRMIGYDDRLDSDDGEAFRWRFVIAAEVGRSERAKIVTRNKNRVRRLLDQGRHPGGQRPYGYTTAPGPNGGVILVPEPTEAAAIRGAALRVIAGQPLGQVARWLNAEGPPPRRAPEWTRRVLSQVLTNEHLAGVPLRPGAPAREPILSYATLAHLSEIINNPRTSAERRVRRSAALLAGLLVCYDCGAPMRSSSSRYVCMTRSDGGNRCAGAVSINRARAEAAVEAAFLVRWGALPRIREEVTVAGASERDAVELEIAETMAAMRAAFTPELGARLAAAQARRDELAARPAEVVRRRVATGRTWADEWAAATTEDRRDMLATVIDHVSCHPRGVGLRNRLRIEPRPEVGELDAADLA
jgi:hypothetical protein